jgi:hypothetical protein
MTELVEIAARIDEQYGHSGDVVRQHNWTNVTSGEAFQAMYSSVSARRPASLKGEQWGRALAQYAAEFPSRSDTKAKRLLWNEVYMALRARIAHYDRHTEQYMLDPITFEMVERRKSDAARYE